MISYNARSIFLSCEIDVDYSFLNNITSAKYYDNLRDKGNALGLLNNDTLIYSSVTCKLKYILAFRKIIESKMGLSLCK